MTNAGKRIVRSVRNARAYARGETTAGFVEHVTPDPYYGYNLIEPVTLRHLADGVEALDKARSVTEDEAVTRYCDLAIQEIRKAIRVFTDSSKA